MAAIASAAPSLPFYYYHLPVLTGVAMDMVEFLRLGEETIPNLAGIKYTAHTQHEFQACLNYKNGKFDVLYGYDEMLLGALMVGAKGAIGSTLHFCCAALPPHDGSIQGESKLERSQGTAVAVC